MSTTRPSYSLVRAIHDKYEDDGQDQNNLQNIVVFIPRGGPGIQADGKIRLPCRLTLDNSAISEAGDVAKISDMCSAVRELDLSKNEVRDWKQVLEILQGIPHLEFLNLTNNPLDNSTLPGTLDMKFTSLINLVLNSTNVSWHAVTQLINCCPNLSQLHLSLNHYTTVDIPAGTTHTALTSLFLNDCSIVLWSEVSKLGTAFPNLESLNLIHTNISDLSDDPVYVEFSKLTALNLSDTQINSWHVIDKCQRFPVLTHLRISGIPLTEEWEEKVRRQHLVSRLPNITHLNASPISDIEREDAERALIRHFMDLDEKPDRYTELVAKYGKLDPLAEVDLAPTNSIHLPVIFEAKREVMEINVQQTVLEFKKLLQNFTGLPSSQMRLFHLQNVDRTPCIHSELSTLSQKTKKLLSLNLQEGDAFEIISK